jgi:3-oxoacyl-[acyl-carrier protein] reductase
MERYLEGSVAIVTGGSRGIGRAIAIELARRGAKVAFSYISRSDAAQETIAACAAVDGTATAFQCDVINSEQVQESVDRVVTDFGRVDILVNNAGISRDGLFVRMKDEDWNLTLATNLNGAFYFARAVTKPMMKARGGRIINISSVVGEMGNAGQASYVTSKAGLIGFTKSLAVELASRSITVNAVAPGFIETEMTDVLDDKTKEAHLSHIPLKRFGSASEVAAVVSFLSSPAAAYITGQTIRVNGGMYL